MDLDNSPEFEEYYKVIIVGNSGAGKTNILKTYDKGVKPNHTTPTIGIDYCSKVLTLDNHRIKIQVWDTAGQEHYRSITMSHYKGAAGALVVYDVTNRASFNDVSRWISDVRERANDNLVLGIVANKTDLDRPVVSREEGENLASRERAFYMETNIHKPESINKTFERLTQQIYRSNKTKNLQFSRTNVELHNTGQRQSGCEC